MLVIASLVLTACGGGAAPATSAPATGAADAARLKPTDAPSERPTAREAHRSCDDETDRSRTVWRVCVQAQRQDDVYGL